MLEACRRDSALRLFRNNVGVCLDTGVRYGLLPGSGDAIGYRSVVVSPDMVGKKIAQFVSVEFKSERGRLSAEQKRWIDNVNDAGGDASVVRRGNS